MVMAVNQHGGACAGGVIQRRQNIGGQPKGQFAVWLCSLANASRKALISLPAS
jgi:hypothetical protein